MLAGITTLKNNTYNQTPVPKNQHLSIPRYNIGQNKFETEMIRFYRARDKVQCHLEQLRDQTNENNDRKQAQEFELYIQLLTNQDVETATNDAVADGLNIEAAALDALDKYADLLTLLDNKIFTQQDRYIKELSHKLLWHLAQIK